MGKAEKLLAKLASTGNTFAWTDLVTLLTQQGYQKQEMEGSRGRFYHPERDHLILLHKPHPENYIKGGALKAVKDGLKQAGIL